MIRADALLVKMNIASRSEAKRLIKSGRIIINRQLCKKPEQKFDENNLYVSFNNKDYLFKEHQYFLLNKPSGCVSATSDNQSQTVLNIFKSEYKLVNGDLYGVDIDNLFPVGRLDKDTVGLLILSNDGEFAHRVLSPKNHVEKEYYVRTDLPLSADEIKIIEAGVPIGEGIISKPSKIKVNPDGNNSYSIVICEGKFHQIKNMFKAVGKNVIYLKRIRFGNLVLDGSLEEGHYIELNDEIIAGLK